MDGRQYILLRQRARPPIKRRKMLIAGGIAASIVLHSSLLTPFALGGHRARARYPDVQGASTSKQNQKSLESMLVVFQEDSSSITDTSQVDDQPLNLQYLLPQPPILPISKALISQAEVNISNEPDDKTCFGGGWRSVRPLPAVWPVHGSDLSANRPRMAAAPVRSPQKAHSPVESKSHKIDTAGSKK